MRLSEKEIQVITQVARKIYGMSVEVYLFGSRTDENKRGGDIDLLIRNTAEKKGILARIRMIAELKGCWETKRSILSVIMKIR